MENYQHEWILWLVCCLGGGIGAAMSLYYGVERWKRSQLWMLATLRALSFAAILFLLVAPTFEKQNWKTEPSLFLVAWDNSASLGYALDSLWASRSLRNLRNTLKRWSVAQETELRWYYIDQSLGDTTDGLRFEAPRSKIGGLINETTARHEGDHVVGLLLLSDGLQNQGPSLDQVRVPYPLYVLGVGDTVSRRDLVLEQLLYNRSAYEGTELQIKVLLSQRGYTGAPIEVVVEGPNGQRALRQLSCSGARLEEVEFSFPAPSSGSYRYRVRIRPQEGERSTSNNEQSAFIRVLKDKLKVLILAPYPHPDVSALYRALKLRSYYETKVVVWSKGAQMSQATDYHLAILYDAFAEEELMRIYQQLQAQGTPIWYLITARSRRSLLSSWAARSGLGLGGRMSLPLATIAAPSGSLPFEDHMSFIDRLELYPPLKLPNFELHPSDASKVLLNQSNDEASRPLWWIEGHRAISLGSGIWQWRLQEAKSYEAPRLFDQLVLGLSEYLSSSNDKRHFRVYPVSPLISTGEPALFRSEVYDANFVPRYGDVINLMLKHSSTHQIARYTYTHRDQLFRIKALDTGTYSYEAVLEYEPSPLYSRGRLYVEDQNIEQRSLQADFPILRRLAKENQGSFHTLEDSLGFLSKLEQIPTHPRRYAQSKPHRLVEWIWILLLLLGLLLSEWTLRKQFGSL